MKQNGSIHFRRVQSLTEFLCKSKVLPTYAKATLNSKPTTPANKVITRFSATICPISSIRVLPKARRTPISDTR